MQTRQIVVIGTSAGGLEALRDLVAKLPADFAVPIAIVLHTAPQSPGVLHEILGRAGPLPAHVAHDRERILNGHIYVPPPDCHLLVEPGLFRVTKGPKENRFRPAIDPLFRSAAQVFGPAAIGVVLTGNLDDGTAGLWTIKQLGGATVVQDPHDALYPSMPQSAIRHVRVDHIVPLCDIEPLLARLTSAPQFALEIEAPKTVGIEVDIAKEKNSIDAGLTDLYQPSSYACPECHGVLLEIEEGGRVRFRCHTGHAYSADSLIAAVVEGVDEALWNAIRALEEGGLLMRRMAEHYRESHSIERGRFLDVRAADLKRQSDTVRELAMESSLVEATRSSG